MEGTRTPSALHMIAIVVGVGSLFALTADWTLQANVDTIAAAFPAWAVATSASIALDEFARANPWIVDTDLGLVSNRPPGTWLIAVPAYVISNPDGFTNVPATATAIAVTVGALLVVYLTLCRLVPIRAALAGTLVLGIGTSTWQVSADALWPHGPGQLWASFAVLALAGGATVRAGWAMAAALLTRPITAIHSATIGLLESWRQRSLLPALGIGLPAICGLAALLAYNRWVFGSWSISGGYSSGFTDRLTTEPIGSHLANVVGFFVSPNNGLFVWSPVLLIATVGTVQAWSTIPGWVRSAAIGALLYVVVHARLNRVSGGIPFGYRYPLEPLVLAAPALMLGAFATWTASRSGRRVITVTALISVALQVLLVTALRCNDPGGVGYATCSFFGTG